MTKEKYNGDFIAYVTCLEKSLRKAQEVICVKMELLHELQSENVKLKFRLATAEQQVHDLRSAAMVGDAC